MTCAPVVMISGANRGIGKALVETMLAKGWRVSLGIRGGNRPDWLAELPSDRLLICAYDAGLGDDEQRWFAATRKALGPVHCVIANAGVIIAKDVVSITDAEMEHMMAVNAQAPRRLARAAWADLQAAGHGRVVIIASLSGKRVKSALSGSYSMTKYAAVALAHGLRHAGFADGIRATAICPGFVATDMARALSDRASEAMTRPEDIAALVATVIALPNEASIAELSINCQAEELY